MAKIVKELGVLADIIGRMVVTPPDQIVWLTPNNLRAMGTVLTGKPAQAQVANSPSQILQGRQVAQAPPPTTWDDIITTWDDIIKTAIVASATQHNGKPQFVRTCQA